MVLEEIKTPRVQKNDEQGSKLYDIPQYSSFIVGKLDEVCKWCGAISEKGDRFCINCGTALNTPEKLATKCPACNSRVEETDKFCINCGTSIISKQKQVYYCHICVSKVEPEDEFCVNCGSILFNNSITLKVIEKPSATIEQKIPEIATRSEEIIPVYNKIKNEVEQYTETRQYIETRKSTETERIIPVYSKLIKSDDRVKFIHNEISSKNSNTGQVSEQKMVSPNNGNCPRCGAKIINEQYCLDCLVLFRRY